MPKYILVPVKESPTKICDVNGLEVDKYVVERDADAKVCDAVQVFAEDVPELAAVNLP